MIPLLEYVKVILMDIAALQVKQIVKIKQALLGFRNYVLYLFTEVS